MWEVRLVLMRLGSRLVLLLGVVWAVIEVVSYLEGSVLKGELMLKLSSKSYI